MNKINLDYVIDNNIFSDYSVEYQRIKNILQATTSNLNKLETEINKNNDISFLLLKYSEVNRDELLSFLANNPLFTEYLRDKVKFEKYSSALNNYVNAFHLDNIKTFIDCKHVFGIVNGKLACLNCSLNQSDLLIKNEEELNTFKDVLIQKGRYAGEIRNDEIAYMSVIYDQFIDNKNKKILKRYK